MHANDAYSEACSDDVFTRQLLTTLRESARLGIGVQLDSDACKTLFAYIERLQSIGPRPDNVVPIPTNGLDL